MSNETRVNLLHLLEDIRDSYALPIEEVIITELVANALDSGASRIEFSVKGDARTISCLDNGRGMRRRELKDYHNIAATTKERGRGIGFAGIGAKLSLLVASQVITETRGSRGTRAATAWHLSSPIRAPWKYIPFSGSPKEKQGTSVTIEIERGTSPLLDPEFIRQTIEKHFYPILHPRLIHEILRFVYRHGVEFFVNGMKIELPHIFTEDPHYFQIFLGRGNRRPVGFGFLSRSPGTTKLPEWITGLSVATHGKIVKRGWEWLGVFPRSFTTLCGVVEIPGLAELLTTNKTDFLNDATSLKKYYRYRKAIQEAVLSSLQKLGEARIAPEGEFTRELRVLSRAIEETLGHLVPDFPELSTLVGVRRYTVRAGEASPYETIPKSEKEERQEYLRGVPNPTAVVREGTDSGRLSEPLYETQTRPPEEIIEDSAGGIKSIKKTPGLKIAFEDFQEDGIPSPLGRIVDERIFINTRHPAWKRAQEKRLEEYHTLITVAWTLAQFLESEHSPHDFVSKFLSAWGTHGSVSGRLFDV